MIVPQNPEVGAWKENVGRKMTMRVKPMFGMLMEKYIRQQQDGVYGRWRKRPRSSGYRYGMVNSLPREGNRFQYPVHSWSYGRIRCRAKDRTGDGPHNDT
jgi:hypothetical protein